MNRLTNHPWFYRIIALFFAVLLFSYVHLDNINSTRQADSEHARMLATKSVTISTPLQINGNINKYFVTGFPKKVKVTLTGPNALVTTTQNTRNFRIYANLEGLGLGKHTIKLKADGLNRGLKYSLSPKQITVNVQQKEDESFPIQVRYNKENIADGYKVGQVKLSNSVVKVTGAKTEISKIDQVIAQVPVQADTRKDVERTVMLQAIDSQGNIVNCVLDPQTVQVTLPIKGPSKKVSLHLNQTGADGNHYSLSTDTKKVTISGDQDDIEKIDSVTANVDVSDVNDTATKKVNVEAPSGVTADPAKVDVKIKLDKSDSSSK